MFNADISKVPYLKIVIVIFFLFASIIAPFWFYFQFAPSIFKQYELVKLLLLSSSIGVPLIILNMTMSMMVEGLNKSKDEEEDFFYTHLIIGCVFSIGVLYVPLLLTFFGHVSLFLAKLISAITEILIIAIFLLSCYGKRMGIKPS